MTRPFHQLLGATILVGAAMLSLRAEAQPADSRSRATKLYDEANRLYDAGKTAEAEAKYEEAWALQPSFEIATNLANVELLIGQTAEAASHLAHALRVLPSSRDADRPKIEKLLGDARARIATVDVQTEAGATISVDGKTVGLAPLPVPVFLMPGAHTIAAERGGRKGSKELTATAGSSEPVSLELKAAGAAPPPTQPPVSPPGGNAEGEGISWVPGAVIGGVGLVAVGVGVGFFAAAGSASSDGEALKAELTADGVSCGAGATDPRCQEGQDADSRHDSFQVGGGILLGVGAAAVVTGGVLLILAAGGKSEAEQSALRVQPVASPSVGGFLVRGSF